MIAKFFRLSCISVFLPMLFVQYSSFGSRGLYFSVSKMTSSQKNTISGYKQDTDVEIAIKNQSPADVVDVASIEGKTFDYTIGDNAGSNYSSYKELKDALHSEPGNKKYLVGDVTFKLKTSTYDLTSEYKLDDEDAKIILNGVNGQTQDGTTPVVVKPSTTGGTINYTINGSTKSTSNDIVIPKNQSNNICIFNQDTGAEACASSAYIKSVYGTNVDKISTESLFFNIKNHQGVVVTSSEKKEDGSLYTLYQVGSLTKPVGGQYPSAYQLHERGSFQDIGNDNDKNGKQYLEPSGNSWAVKTYDSNNKPENNLATAYDPESYILQDDGTFTKWKTLADTDKIYYRFAQQYYSEPIKSYSEPIENPISSLTLENASVTKTGNGNAIGVSSVNGVNTVSSDGAGGKMTVDGSMKMNTNYACTESTNINNANCNLEGFSTNPNANNTVTKRYYDSKGMQLINNNTKTETVDLTKNNLIINNQSQMQTIALNGNATFSNTTLKGGAGGATFANITTIGNVTKTNEVEKYTNYGLQLRAPAGDQFDYIATPTLSVLQNISFNPVQVSVSFSDAIGTKNNPDTDLWTDVIGAATMGGIEYNDNGQVLRGQDAVNKFSEMEKNGYNNNTNNELENNYSSILDASYTMNSINNRMSAEDFAMNTNDSTPCSDSTTQFSILGCYQNFSNLTSGLQSNAEKFANGWTNAMADSKKNNLAQYEAVYLKADESKGYFNQPEKGYVKSNSSSTEPEYNKNLNVVRAKNSATAQDNNVVDYYNVTLRAKNWTYEIQKTKELIQQGIKDDSLAPQFSSQTQMQSFIDAFSGRSSNGFEASVGYKFRMFKSSFFTAPQFDISMFRNANSLMTGIASDKTTYTYGNIDSSYAGSLVAKFGFENKISLGGIKIPFSIYGFGGGTSALTTYRQANSQSFGLKYGFGAEIFISKQIAFFGEMFRIDFLKQNVNYSTAYTDYTPGDNTRKKLEDYVNAQSATTVVIDNSQVVGQKDTKNIQVDYADLNQVLDINNITYKTTEKFDMQNSIAGVKFGVTYYVE